MTEIQKAKQGRKDKDQELNPKGKAEHKDREQTVQFSPQIKKDLR